MKLSIALAAIPLIAVTVGACAGAAPQIAWTSQPVPAEHADTVLTSRSDSCDYRSWIAAHAAYQMVHTPLPPDSVNVGAETAWVVVPRGRPGVRGSVALAFVIDTLGQAEHIDVMSVWLAEDSLADAPTFPLNDEYRRLMKWAVASAREWTFRPALSSTGAVWGWACVVVINDRP
jgi:hypothetical protein